MEGQSASSLPPPRTGAGRGLFLWGLTVGAGVLAVGVYQVPQPWRGWLIGWLLFMGTLGLLILRFLRHYYQYRMAQLAQRKGPDAEPLVRSAPSVSRVDDLQVVILDQSKGERFTL